MFDGVDIPFKDYQHFVWPFFKSQVTYRSLKLEARIGKEERNSNSTKLVTVRGLHLLDKT